MCWTPIQDFLNFYISSSIHTSKTVQITKQEVLKIKKKNIKLMKRAICLYHLLIGPNCDLISHVIREHAEAIRHQPWKDPSRNRQTKNRNATRRVFPDIYIQTDTLINKHIYLSFERLNRNYLDCFVHISHYRDIIC